MNLQSFDLFEGAPIKNTPEVIAQYFKKVLAMVEEDGLTIQNAIKALKLNSSNFYKMLNPEQKRELQYAKTANAQYKSRGGKQSYGGPFENFANGMKHIKLFENFSVNESNTGAIQDPKTVMEPAKPSDNKETVIDTWRHAIKSVL